MKKLLLFLGLAAAAYWFVRGRLGGDIEEFAFTEVSPAEAAEPVASPPAAG
ncbi:MAG: hypothetical protein AB1416_09385 [Actinomycetota bacterium]